MGLAVTFSFDFLNRFERLKVGWKDFQPLSVRVRRSERFGRIQETSVSVSSGWIEKEHGNAIT